MRAKQSCGEHGSEGKICSLPKASESSGCSGQAGSRDLLQTYEDVVRHYLECCAPAEEEYVRFYREQLSLADAINKAALAEVRTGARFSHQRRVPRKTLLRLKDGLRRRALEDVRSFDELHEIVREVAQRIPGIKDLTIYDTAHRLGAYLGLRPKHVYLHAGAREGADALGIIGDKTRLHISELPGAFRQLMPEQAEDCLCIYKSELIRIAEQLKQRMAA
jgi:hypothetical protein